MSNYPESRQLDGYLTVTKAALYIGVAVNTLRNWDKAGKVVARRHPVNGWRLYSLEDLNLLLRTVEKNPDKAIRHAAANEPTDDSTYPSVKSERVK